MDGKKHAGIALPVAKFITTSDGKVKTNQVLERLPLGHARTQYIRLHLDLAALLYQYPHICGVPVLDVVTETATEKKAVPVYSQSASDASNWPTVKIEGESCCVFQLLGLTQFPVVPRHPQSQNPKVINWGIEHGLVVTYLYGCWAPAADAGSSAIEIQ